jgi:hypothetical protein
MARNPAWHKRAPRRKDDIAIARGGAYFAKGAEFLFRHSISGLEGGGV